MKLILQQFFAQTTRTHMSMARETGISRQNIENWLNKNRPVYVEFDERSEVIDRITFEPVKKTIYKRGE